MRSADPVALLAFLAKLPPHDLFVYTMDDGTAFRAAALYPDELVVARDEPLPINLVDGDWYIYGSGQPLQRLVQLWRAVDECFRLIQVSYFPTPCWCDSSYAVSRVIIPIKSAGVGHGVPLTAYVAVSGKGAPTRREIPHHHPR